MDAVEAARSGAVTPPEGSALAVVAGWREPDGKALPPRVAAVELLNLIRPYVAVAAFLTFAAQRLAISPEWRARLGAEPGMARPFVTEVRRTAPFFPMIVARARRRTAWRDCRIPKGRLVMLDIYGTNRDPQVWEGPGAFRPERFAGKEPGPFDMIPQGGGDHAEGHRCSGEWVTEELMIAALPVLLDGIDWDNLPRQDLELDMRRLPALPKDRFRLA
jgi:fatty-acid peroxygenase